MQTLIFRFFDICLLRAGPQDIPASLFLLRLVVVLSVIVGVFLNLQTEGFSQSLMISLFNVVWLTAFLYFSLQLRGKLPRFKQSIIAMMGTNVILGLLIMPFMYHLVAAEAAGESAPFAFQLFLLLLVWDITVFAHIIRHSLDIRLGYGFVISLGYLILSWWVIEMIFAA
ncbi:MAG: hypothetical protein KAT25_00730 [Sulfuriflexus sp.]|nr:hypothetical protein [Sulfuriflexus sp.]